MTSPATFAIHRVYTNIYMRIATRLLSAILQGCFLSLKSSRCLPRGRLSTTGTPTKSVVAVQRGNDLSRLVRFYQRALHSLRRFQDYADWAQTVIGWLELDWMDVRDFANSLVDVKRFMNNMPKINKQITATVKLPDKVLSKMKRLVRILGKNDKFQELLGEMGTALVTYALGFQPTTLRFHSVHGPDQVSQHVC